MNLLANVRPICAICKTQIEHMQVYEDPRTGDIVYDLRCHGETQEFVLSAAEIVHSLHIDIGTAFNTPKAKLQIEHV